MDYHTLARWSLVVYWAVILCLVAVLIPLLLMGGIIGRLFREPADRGSRHGYFGLDMHDRLLGTIQREQNGSGVVECRVAVFKCADKSNELRERFLHLWHEAGKKFLENRCRI